MTGRATHGHTRGGKSPTFLSWIAMRNRCCNPKNEKYPAYGGRGIKVCDRWLDNFGYFLADMGERPEGHTLDRYPKRDGNYEPGNCRWATAAQQAENRNTHGCGWKRDRSHCSNGHEFTTENTRITKKEGRKCRECERLHASDARARKRASA